MKWQLYASEYILNRLQSDKNLLRKSNSYAIVLTGGRAANILYSQLAVDGFIDFLVDRCSFYITDERCVAVTHPLSNFSQINASLFSNSPKTDVSFYPMVPAGEYDDFEVLADRYSALLPNYIDLTMLSVGEDGHIASLFPFNSALSSHRNVIYVNDSPKEPTNRITISPSIIANSCQVILLAIGYQKGYVLALALESPDDIESMPVRLTLGRIWILDKEASDAFHRFNTSPLHGTTIVYV